ncbi:basic proline-rich protein-like [Rhinolophus ferrumequinum]|uniref:basic proline-rich protein-like n=1 Tax=Rhinolophus ferrumequinum TaxID=59479 RepID=UPI00140F5CB4|nr:basic proline-rich protein-like [Rhinolophus ferrumequinum]
MRRRFLMVARRSREELPAEGATCSPGGQGRAHAARSATARKVRLQFRSSSQIPVSSTIHPVDWSRKQAGKQLPAEFTGSSRTTPWKTGTLATDGEAQTPRQSPAPLPPKPAPRGLQGTPPSGAPRPQAGPRDPHSLRRAGVARGTPPPAAPPAIFPPPVPRSTPGGGRTNRGASAPLTPGPAPTPRTPVPPPSARPRALARTAPTRAPPRPQPPPPPAQGRAPRSLTWVPIFITLTSGCSNRDPQCRARVQPSRRRWATRHSLAQWEEGDADARRINIQSGGGACRARALPSPCVSAARGGACALGVGSGAGAAGSRPRLRIAPDPGPAPSGLRFPPLDCAAEGVTWARATPPPLALLRRGEICGAARVGGTIRRCPMGKAGRTIAGGGAGTSPCAGRLVGPGRSRPPWEAPRRWAAWASGRLSSKPARAAFVCRPAAAPRLLPGGSEPGPHSRCSRVPHAAAAGVCGARGLCPATGLAPGAVCPGVRVPPIAAGALSRRSALTTPVPQKRPLCSQEPWASGPKSWV